MGPLGVGWSSPWLTTASIGGDGTITINEAGGESEIFQPDSRTAGAYLSRPFDAAVLAADGSGGYLLTEPDGRQTDFTATGQLAYVRDSDGNRITADYAGTRLTSLTASSGQSLHLTYNAAGLIASVSDSTGRTTSYGYDPTNTYLTSATGFDGQSVGYTYNTSAGSASHNALISIAYPNGTHQYFTYDGQGRVSGTSGDGNAAPASYGYSLGQVTITDGTGDTTNFYYNENGLIARRIDALGNPTYYGYDSSFHLTKITNALNESESYSVNSVGEVTSSTDFLGNTTYFSYGGPHNNLTSMTDANGNTTSYAYNSAGDLLSTTFANGKQQTSLFDPLGQAMAFINANGQPITFTYNSAGQLTKESFADGSQYGYSYDAHGDLLSATDARGTTTFRYDPTSGLMSEVAYPNGTFLKFAYNASGLRTQMVDQTGYTVNYAYDPAGRLSGLTDGSGNPIVGYAYDPNGRLNRKTNANGTYSTYAYDGDGNIIQLTNFAPGGTVNSSFGYTYNALGLQTGQTTVDGSWTYVYDGNGELTHAVFTPNTSKSHGLSAEDITYAYDAMGNRTGTLVNGVSTAYAVNSMNQYTSVGGIPYSYDADGNLLSDGVNAYSYNALNQLTAITTPSGTTTFAYNALGEQIASSTGGQTTQYLIDPGGTGTIAATLDGAGNVFTRFTYGLGLASQITGINRSASTFYYDFDGQGSTTGLSNAAGQYVDTLEYQPFGGTVGSLISVPSPFDFLGQFSVLTDPSGIVLTEARPLSTITGRFMTPDPLGLAAGDLNAYRYTYNDPSTLIDPTGLTAYTYNQSTGQFTGGNVDTTGYSGTGSGRNNPAEQNVPNVGPIPAGTYTVGTPYNSSHTGPMTYPLNPSDDTRQNFPEGRDPDSFRVHGNNSQNDASQGCIILPPGSRSQLQPGDTVTVIPGTGGDTGDPGGPGDSGDAGGGDGSGDSGDPGDPGGPGGAPGAPGGGDGGGGTSSTVNAQDPNALYGPAGYGTSNYVAPASGESFPYQIDFENSPTATSPAQEVTITEQLDPRLNWSTFQLTGIGFGDVFVTVPAGVQDYQTMVPVTYQGQAFELQIHAGIRAATGQVYAVFQSLDPSTGLPPANPLLGFLPPEDGTGRGSGYVSYSVSPKANLPTGAQITAVALVTFDQGLSIATDQVNDEDPTQGISTGKQALVTIDVGAPTSAVTALPAIESSTNFTVSWSGQDDVSGSGVASYTIYLSIDGGAFVPWLTNTTQTSAPFSGNVGHTYAFYSQATDNVGNVEAAHAAADTLTRVSLSAPQVRVESFAYDHNPSTLSFTFTSDVSASLMTSSIVVTNVTTGTTIVPKSVAYDHTTNTATFTLPANLPDGNYQARLLASAITDAGGSHLDGLGNGTTADFYYQFYVLAGDVNRDRVVTTADFLTLSKNFGKTNATYAQGDVNGDGTVNLADLLLLTRNMGKSLPVPVSPHAVEVDAAGYRGQTVWVTFSSDVSGSLTPAALSITNVATGKRYSPVSVSYDAGTNTATFVFGGVLPEGNYAATLLASQVANAAGYRLDGNGDGVAGDDYTLGFYNLAGDLNGDGTVGTADFQILSQNFGKTGAIYAQGDLNGDGIVNLADLLLLTRDFGHTAPRLSATDVLLATVKAPKPLAASRRR